MKSEFRYRENRMYAEECDVEQIAERYGTPLYIYSKKQIIDNLNSFHTGFRGIPNLICYALKANSNLSLLRILAQHNTGADIVSGGELERAIRAGIPASKIVFAGVGKTESEIQSALKRKVLMINVESADELVMIDRIAGRMRRNAPIALRVNPDIDPKTHPYISTGLEAHKFGIPLQEAVELYSYAARLRHLKILGMHMHLGSQILSASPYIEALTKVLSVVDSLDRKGIPIHYLDIGGGLGIDYESSSGTLSPKALATKLKPLFKGRPQTLIVEPGRSIVANAGILVSRVLYIKKNKNKKFTILDAGMNDFIRPALYDAYHRIQPVRQSSRKKQVVDIVGPVCETGDFFAIERKFPEFLPGELVAMMETGAYGSSMSSNYNSRPRAAEVLVEGNHFRLIRKRETFKDLIRQEAPLL